uniref:Uncharacterized protein n=1 Tax=Avena sativa TaxID=4498 RepID=A0ACD5WSM3_AVESA
MANPTLMRCLLAVSLLSSVAHAELSKTFYNTSCHSLDDIVWAEMKLAVNKERRTGASLLRLFFHDCFVQGCDGSILLDNGGEKSAGPNADSVRGFDVIDTIKASVEKKCPGVVSCADILALAARDGTYLLGGPSGRAARAARLDDGERGPRQRQPPGGRLQPQVAHRQLRQARALAGRHDGAVRRSHTIGLARCTTFRDRIYNDSNIDASFANQQQQMCPQSGDDSSLVPMDVKTPMKFDSVYFQNLVDRRGLLHSDQELFSGGSQDALVRQYSSNPALFRDDFARAMIKLGNIKPLTGTAGQIRANCRLVNTKHM